MDYSKASSSKVKLSVHHLKKSFLLNNPLHLSNANSLFSTQSLLKIGKLVVIWSTTHKQEEWV